MRFAIHRVPRPAAHCANESAAAVATGDTAPPSPPRSRFAFPRCFCYALFRDVSSPAAPHACARSLYVSLRAPFSSSHALPRVAQASACMLPWHRLQPVCLLLLWGRGSPPPVGAQRRAFDSPRRGQFPPAHTFSYSPSVHSFILLENSLRCDSEERPRRGICCCL